MHSVHCGSLELCRARRLPGTEIREAFCRSWCDKVLGEKGACMLTEDEELPHEGEEELLPCTVFVGLWIGFLCSFRTQEEVEVEEATGLSMQFL